VSGSEVPTVDPNATLAEVRAILSHGRFEDLVPTDSHRLVELIEGLDGWLTGGGFLGYCQELWIGRWWPRGVLRSSRSIWMRSPKVA
jgi:CBS domain-containing protein